MLGLDGQVETPYAMYASTRDGRLVKIIARGDRAPDGGIISDLGAPAVLPDGVLIFGAEVNEGKSKWRILRADPNQQDERIHAALDQSGVSSDCRPMLAEDPHVIAGPERSVVFVAKDQNGRGTLFRYANGRVTCDVRSGDRTAEGHLIVNLGFASEQPGDHGAVVLRAALATNAAQARRYNTKSAIVLVMPGTRASEVAVESSPIHGSRYGKQFGLPGLSQSDGKPLVAFTSYGGKGAALFVGRPNDLHTEIESGPRTPAGSLSFLSDQRPSLGDDGSVAIRAASGGRSLILQIRAGEPSVIAREGEEIAGGQKITGLGDPVRSASGRLYDEVMVEGEMGRVCSFSQAGPPSILSGTIDVFPSSFAVNRNDQFAFLARHTEKRTANLVKEQTRTGTSL